MAEQTVKMLHEDQRREVERQASQSQHTLVRELMDFLLHNKKWWLTPVFVVLLAFGLLLALGGTGAAPFIYALF